jgi:hypothetical protein
MNYEKLTEVHDDALYSIHTEISSDFFSAPYNKVQSICWIVNEREQSKREYSNRWFKDCELDSEGKPKHIDVYEDTLINEMFSGKELNIILDILNRSKHVIKITVNKYNCPLEKYKYPSMSNGDTFFHNVTGNCDWFNLSEIIPKEEINSLLNDTGILILGIVRLEGMETKTDDENNING